MPIYEYRCGACGHEMEAMQKMADAPLTDCPECGKADLTKLVSAAGFVLKGGGWYETDFKNKSSHSTGKSSASKESSADKPSAHSCGTACGCN